MASQYGFKLYRHGIELRSDGRRREKLPGRPSVMVRRPRRPTCRRRIKARSLGSAKSLAFIAANIDPFFAAYLTLTYWATQEAWETAGARNLRFVNRCRADQHRPLWLLRDEIGDYIWVR